MATDFFFDEQWCVYACVSGARKKKRCWRKEGERRKEEIKKNQHICLRQERGGARKTNGARKKIK